MSRTRQRPPTPRPPGAHPPILRRVLVLLAPTVVVLGLALAAMLVHRPTRVELVLTVDRFTATLAPDPSGQGSTALINHGQVRSVRIDRPSRVSLASTSLEVLDGEAWRALTLTGRPVLEPVPDAQGLAPAVTLHTADGAPPGVIKAVRAPAGTLMAMDLATGTKADQVWLTLDLTPNAATNQAADPARVHLTFPGPVQLDADYLRLTEDLAGASPADLRVAGYPDSLSLRARSNRIVMVKGSAQGLVIQLEPAGSADALLRDLQIPIATVDFTRQGPGGEHEGSLVAPGTLSYPDAPNKAPVAVSATDFVSLGPIEKARIKRVSVASDGGRTGLKLTLDAVVALGARIGTPEQPQDARLTWFDWIWDSPALRILFSIAGWLFPTSLAGYKLWQTLRTPAEDS